MNCTCQEGIIIRQGDDTNALGNSIIFNLTTELDLTGFKAVFQVDELRYEWNDITNKQLYMDFSADDTAKLPVGTSYGALKIYDSNGLATTVISNIPVRVLPLVVENIPENSGE